MKIASRKTMIELFGLENVLFLEEAAEYDYCNDVSQNTNDRIRFESRLSLQHGEEGSIELRAYVFQNKADLENSELELYDLPWGSPEYYAYDFC